MTIFTRRSIGVIASALDGVVQRNDITRVLADDIGIEFYNCKNMAIGPRSKSEAAYGSDTI